MKVKKAFWIFAILTVLVMVADRILFVIFPNYLLRKGFSATEIGLVFSIASLILLISRTFIGKISDILGRKTIMSLGLLMRSLTVPFYPVVTKLYEFSLLKGLKDFSKTLTSSVEDALKADVFKKKIRAKILAKLGTVYPLSRAVGAIVGFIITTYLSLVHGFYIAALALFFSFLVFFLFFEEKKKRVKIPRFRFEVRRYSRPFILISLIGLLTAINFTASYFPGFFILAKNLGITENILFLLLLGDYIISSIFAYQSRKWIDKFGRKKTVLVGSLMFSLFIIMYPFSSSIIQFFLILLGVSVSYYVWRIAIKTVLMDETTEEIRGEQIGFSKTLEGIGDMVGPAIGGFLIDNISLSSAFFFGGGAGLVSVIMAYFLVRR